MKKFSLLLNYIVICCLIGAGTANAQDEIFSISQNTAFSNYRPEIAVNPASGDAVVVWRQYDSKTESSSIYACYCKYLGAGKFKAGKPRLLSEGKGRNEFASVAYDPVSKSFLVVWDKLEWFSAPTSKAFNILARRLNAKGRIKGGEIHITDSKDDQSEQPAIVSRAVADGAPAGSGGFLVMWVHYPMTSGGLKRGICAVTVNAKGKLTSEPQNVFEPPAKSGFYNEVWLYEVAISKAGNCILTFFLWYSDESDETWLAEVDLAGNGLKSLKIADEYLSGGLATTLSSKLYLFSWTERYEADFFHQLVKANLKKKKKPFTTTGEYAFSELVGMELDGGGAYLVAFESSHVDICRFNQRGKLVGSRVTKDLSVYVSSFYDCVLLPDGKCLVSSSRNKGSGNYDSEVFGFTLDLE